MSKVVLPMMMSPDGRIARADGDLGWFVTDARFEERMLGLLRRVEAMMFGRVSYQLLADYWPTAGTPAAADAPGGFTSQAVAVEFARLMNSIPKIVFSRTLREAAWGPVRVVRDGIALEIRALTRRSGRDLVLFAGANLAATFMQLDLVDEYPLMVHPVVLGRGPRLVEHLAPERRLSLVEVEAMPSGVVVMRHARGQSTESRTA